MNSLIKMAQGSKPGAQANAYKGNSVSYSAKHKRASNTNTGSTCSNCGSKSNLVNATIHGSNGNRHKTLCRSCHAKYDKFDSNINKKSSIEAFIDAGVMLLKQAQVMNPVNSESTQITQPGFQSSKNTKSNTAEPKPSFGYAAMFNNNNNGAYTGPFNTGYSSGFQFGRNPMMTRGMQPQI